MPSKMKKKRHLTNKRIFVIASTVAEHFGHTPDMLAGKSRTASIVKARQLSYVLAQRMSFSCTEISEQFGHGDDHATVLRGIKRVEKEKKLLAKLEEKTNKDFEEGKYDANFSASSASE